MLVQWADAVGIAVNVCQAESGGELPTDLFLDGMRKLNAVVLCFQPPSVRDA